MYLYQYFNEDEVRLCVEGLAREFQMEVLPDCKGSNICSTIKLIPSRDFTFYLSEFPGNCSSLVLHGIESFLSGTCESTLHTMGWRALWLSAEIAISLSYGALWITGVNEVVKELLEKNGFVVTTNIFNPHSRKYPYFAVLHLGGKDRVALAEMVKTKGKEIRDSITGQVQYSKDISP